MKKNHCLLAVLCIICFNVSAHDIEVPNADGVTIYYNYINNDTELAVTFSGYWYGYVNNEYSGDVVIPEEVTLEGRTLTVTRIEDNTFFDCPNLTSVTIGNNVTSIGEYAFSGCTSLKSITIPRSVTHIGNYAFYQCSALNAVHISDLEAWCNIQFDGGFYYYHLYLNDEEITNLTIPKSVTSVSNYAFAKCYRLTSITIPDGVTSIGSYAFAWCLNLQDIYCHAEQVPETVVNVFSNSNYDTTLHVPAASVSAYQAAEPWKNFKEIVALPELDVYRSFIEEGKVWKVGYGSQNPVQWVEYYYFDGDTIIDGRTCKQMMRQRYVTPDFFDYDNVSQLPSLSYVGAWYEENEKVYFYKDTNKGFQIMYDFSLGAYDSLKVTHVLWPCVLGPRETGGQKGFKGVYRYVFATGEGHYYYNDTWLEGVGSIEGPTYNFHLGQEDYNGTILMSCTVGDEVIYYNDEYEDGATPEVMDARKRIDFTHTIKTRPKMPRKETTPDPSQEEESQLYGEYNSLQLGINLDPLDDSYTVRIADGMGKVVYEKAFDAASIVGLNIDISAYAAGRYTVTVENGQELFTAEFETLTTDISETLRQNNYDNTIYNLQGQRLSSPQKGLNIVEGRKLYLKNGH